MVVQGFFLIIMGKGLKLLARNNNDGFTFTTVIFCGLITYLGLEYPRLVEVYNIKSYYFAPVLFLLSSSGIMAYEIVSKLNFSQNANALNPYQSIGRFIFIFEVGVLIATALNTFNGHFKLISSTYLNLAPYILIFIPLAIQKVKGQKKDDAISQEKMSEEKVNVWKLPYFKPLLLLACLVLALKSIQDFSLLIGILGLKTQGRSSLTKLYSALFFVQTAISMLLIGWNVRSESTQKFTKKIRLYFILQGISLMFLGLFPLPMVNILSGIGRKIQKKGDLDQAMAKLDKTVSSSVRFHVKTIYSRYSQGFAFIFLGAFSYIYMLDIIPKAYLWFICGIGSFVGLKVLKDFITKLNGENAEQVMNFHHSPLSNYYATESAYALAIPEAKAYAPILFAVYRRRPKTILRKAIIFALGEMRNSKVLLKLILMYEQESNETTQRLILEALMKYKSYDVDLFFQRIIKTIMMNEHKDLIYRENIIRTIAKRNSHTTIMNILTVYHENRFNTDNLGPMIRTIGTVAQSLNDEYLFNVISEYLKPNYPIKVRKIAILYLYKNAEFHEEVQRATRVFEHSPEPEVRAELAEIVGKLELFEYKQFLLNLNRLLRNKNPYIHIALLQLKTKQANDWLFQYLKNSPEQMAISAISYFSEVAKDSVRYEFYHFICSERPDFLDRLVNFMNFSEKDFDQDISLLQEEAFRLGIELSIDSYGFQSKNVHSNRIA